MKARKLAGVILTGCLAIAGVTAGLGVANAAGTGRPDHPKFPDPRPPLGAETKTEFRFSNFHENTLTLCVAGRGVSPNSCWHNMMKGWSDTYTVTNRGLDEWFCHYVKYRSDGHVQKATRLFSRTEFKECLIGEDGEIYLKRPDGSYVKGS
jgi:hypothetical protein